MAESAGIANGAVYTSFDDEMDILITVDRDIEDAVKNAKSLFGSRFDSLAVYKESAFDSEEIFVDYEDEDVLDTSTMEDDPDIGGSEFNSATLAAEEYINAYEELSGMELSEDDAIEMIINSR